MASGRLPVSLQRSRACLNPLRQGHQLSLHRYHSGWRVRVVIPNLPNPLAMMNRVMEKHVMEKQVQDKKIRLTWLESHYLVPAYSTGRCAAACKDARIPCPRTEGLLRGIIGFYLRMILEWQCGLEVPSNPRKPLEECHDWTLWLILLQCLLNGELSRRHANQPRI